MNLSVLAKFIMYYKAHIGLLDHVGNMLNETVKLFYHNRDILQGSLVFENSITGAWRKVVLELMWKKINHYCVLSAIWSQWADCWQEACTQNLVSFRLS